MNIDKTLVEETIEDKVYEQDMLSQTHKAICNFIVKKVIK